MQNIKDKRKFLRQCISCRTYKEKSELIRITKDFKTGEVKINENTDVYGKSVYICKNSNCIKTAIKKRRIEYLLKSEFSEDTKNELLKNEDAEKTKE